MLTRNATEAVEYLCVQLGHRLPSVLRKYDIRIETVDEIALCGFQTIIKASTALLKWSPCCQNLSDMIILDPHFLPIAIEILRRLPT